MVSRLSDVAKAAGVSTAAASLALRGKPGVSEATRERVRLAAESLGYEANVIARNLRLQSTQTIGMHLPFGATSLSYYFSFVQAVASAAAAEGYALLLIPHGADSRQIAGQVDGMIVVDPLASCPSLPDIIRSPKPVITIEKVPEQLGVEPDACLYYDHRTSIRTLLEHTYAHNARHFTVTCPPKGSAWGKHIWEGIADFEQAHDDVEILRLEVPFVVSPPTVEELLQGEFPPTDAVICTSDFSLIDVVSVLRDLGLTAGKDVLLASYVDVDWYARSKPTITSFDHHIDLVAQRSLSILLDLIDERRAGEPPQETLYEVVTPQIIVRDSTTTMLPGSVLDSVD